MITKKVLEDLAKSQTDLGKVSQEKLLQAMQNRDYTLVPNDPISQLVYYIGIMDNTQEAEAYFNYALGQLENAYKVLI
jgi:hypothetical protein